MVRLIETEDSVDRLSLICGNNEWRELHIQMRSSDKIRSTLELIKSIGSVNELRFVLVPSNINRREPCSIKCAPVSSSEWELRMEFIFRPHIGEILEMVEEFGEVPTIQVSRGEQCWIASMTYLQRRAAEQSFRRLNTLKLKQRFQQQEGLRNRQVSPQERRQEIKKWIDGTIKPEDRLKKWVPEQQVPQETSEDDEDARSLLSFSICSSAESMETVIPCFANDTDRTARLCARVPCGMPVEGAVQEFCRYGSIDYVVPFETPSTHTPLWLLFVNYVSLDSAELAKRYLAQKYALRPASARKYPSTTIHEECSWEVTHGELDKHLIICRIQRKLILHHKCEKKVATWRYQLHQLKCNGDAAKE